MRIPLGSCFEFRVSKVRYCVPSSIMKPAMCIREHETRDSCGRYAAKVALTLFFLDGYNVDR